MAEGKLQRVVGAVADGGHGVERGELVAPEGGLVCAARGERTAGENAKDVENRQPQGFAVSVALRRPGIVEGGLGGVFAHVVRVLHVGKYILEVGNCRNVVVHFDPVWSEWGVIHLFRQDPGGAEVVSSTGRVNVIGRLGEIEFVEQVMTKAADVGLFQRESAGQLVLQGYVEGLGVGRLDVVVHAPIDSESVNWRGEGEGLGGRERGQRDIGQVVRAGKAGRVLVAQLVRPIRDAGSEAVGAGGVKGIDQGLSVVVVVHACTGAECGSSIGRPDDAGAWSKVVFLFGPVGGRVVGFAGGSEGNDGFVDFALLRRGFTLLVPGIGIDSGRNLLAVGLIGGLEQGVTHAEGDGDVGAGVPGVLYVALPLVGVEVLTDWCARSKRRAGGRAGDRVVVDVGQLGDDPHEIGPGLAPLVGKARGHVCRHRQITEG